MNQDWRLGLARRLLILTLCCLLLGLISGHYGWSFTVGLAIYLVITLSQLLHLNNWLKRTHTGEHPPEGFGLWAEVFDKLYQWQRHEQRVRANLQAIIDRVQDSTAALQDAVIVMHQGNLEWCNKAAEHLLGLRAPQDFGQTVTNLVRHPAYKEYFDRGQYQDPLELPSPINDRIYLQFTITRYGDGEYLMLVRDITRLHSLEQMRKDFVANVSHELRTPLTVIVGYLETLLEHADEVNPRWVKPLQRMEQQTERMRHLLEDLLLLTKLETTQYPASNQPVVVTNLLQSIKTDAQSLSSDKGHEFILEAEPDLLFKGSESELRSAFSNLVFNAVKYTPSEGKIYIRWWHDTQGAHLSVQDNGIGIDNKHLPRLTERFYRVDSSRASITGGTGLGLAIVKHVLLRHKGWLEIQSIPGQGSTFICHLPAEHMLIRTPSPTPIRA
ncbi:two-component system phosphate regulon sensor histidine kinase PhoR [Azomonas agilis]|uniref:Phosphate regulon sensor protein PhoR n=1 Tax=Azomonas agilis TaxID=116849 RepID=A0A562IKJ1_9GAMM|nr:phosphate regulon sensor histidine kinase PhoR [Azomonas agilis]TWH71392.1 two-component system phosphate regulon sensor histidine kinase PhoR [Azomonas agilis]